MKVISHTHSGRTALLHYTHFTFAGGEEHIRFNAVNFNEISKLEIYVRLTDSATLIRLMMAVDALRRMSYSACPIELVAPYFPYARQDRVCVTGEPLSAAVMAQLINSLKFAKVIIWDAHSDVSPALLNRVVNVPQVELLNRCNVLRQRLASGELTLISPDAGASKKTLQIAQFYNAKPEVIQAQKCRDLVTGNIIRTEVQGDVNGKRLLIADDICDGGRTFIELATVLKAQGAKEIVLFVTHGIFSRGLVVFEGLIDTIITTDSFRPRSEFTDHSGITLHVVEM
ncbi:ribose-phosphate diphosphokinase [Pseudoalteromonas rubra]|uniref:ribose-phosphate diphosphokinase n=1 Tax=Pseudoalteromonas rubra TaxID=43658 RepID=UPI000F77486B|nr:ribose-phosphate diphosphokinase [Pseudoalteromonas rubra]